MASINTDVAVPCAEAGQQPGTSHYQSLLPAYLFILY